jgi:protein OPY2
VCVANPAQNNSGSKGTNSGAIAGGVLAALVCLFLAIGYLWYRRRAQAAAAAFKRATVEVKPEVVASADTVLNRPDPLEKPASMLGQDENVHLAHLGPPENPFSDHASIATASDRATNVIPIGLVTPSSASMALSHSSHAPSANTPASIAPSSTFTVQVTEDPLSRSVPNTPTTPTRPQRAGPEIDMKLDLTRPISESPSLLAPPKVPYAGSSRSGLSGVSSRASTISTSSSFLNEAPQIVTPKQANFRQVLGVQRAAVVQLNSAPGSPAASLKSHPSTSTLGKSPLSQTAFEAKDARGTLDQNAHNPFADYNTRPDTADSKVSNSTFGTSAHGHEATSPLDWDGPERPMSAMSHAESVVNISSAQRVQLIRPMALQEARALLAPPSPSSATPRSADFRSAGQLSPPAQAIPRSFDDAMDYRMSSSSLALTNRTSTTDSILEAFPFVPPSPISMHHNQPSSPLQRAVMQQQQRQAAAHLSTAESEAPSATGATPKPGRMTLGLSTISSTSSGLGSFPFQFDGDMPPPPTLPQEHISDNSSRASLDTLQLSRDLADFPLPLETPATPRGPAPPR